MASILTRSGPLLNSTPEISSGKIVRTELTPFSIKPYYGVESVETIVSLKRKYRFCLLVNIGSHNTTTLDLINTMQVACAVDCKAKTKAEEVLSGNEAIKLHRTRTEWPRFSNSLSAPFHLNGSGEITLQPCFHGKLSGIHEGGFFFKEEMYESVFAFITKVGTLTFTREGRDIGPDRLSSLPLPTPLLNIIGDYASSTFAWSYRPRKSV